MRNELAGASGPVQSVDRAAAILDALASRGPMSVTDLSRLLGVHKSTASRLLATLEGWELVAQREGRGKYHLGVGLLRLAGNAAAGLDLVEQARPVCRRLAAATGLTVNLAVRTHGQALYLDQVAGTSALQSYNWVGQRIPLHATSNGKVLLCELDDGQARALVGTLVALTGATLTTWRALRRERRRRPFAFCTAGLTALAAPVRNAHGEITASVSVSGPTFRLDEDGVNAVRAKLLPAAAEISARLGWRLADA